MTCSVNFYKLHDLPAPYRKKKSLIFLHCNYRKQKYAKKYFLNLIPVSCSLRKNSLQFIVGETFTFTYSQRCSISVFHNSILLILLYFPTLFTSEVILQQLIRDRFMLALNHDIRNPGYIHQVDCLLKQFGNSRNVCNAF